jgi:L,D-transpeptidase YcbB
MSGLHWLGGAVAAALAATGQAQAADNQLAGAVLAARPASVEQSFGSQRAKELFERGGAARIFDEPSASPSRIYDDLRDGLERYRERWSHLPEIEIGPGAILKAGASGERVALLRARLGLPSGDHFDEEVAAAVRDYQASHGLPVDGAAGPATLASLNRGAGYYERIIEMNLERARALPARPAKRYILVDVPAAQLWLYEDGRPRDTMRVIAGKPATETPVLAATLRFAEVNPYWNVPPDLVRKNIAPRVLADGIGYLAERGYEVLSDWTIDAQQLDPSTVDWQAVADGSVTPRVRQRPGGDNAMGTIKFMMSADQGIYLHDTPDKALFQKQERWLSNGCIRVEDARRLAHWLFGEAPQDRPAQPDSRVPLPAPVPVYITYLTAAPAAEGGILFRPDPYGRDAKQLAAYRAEQVGAAELLADARNAAGAQARAN